MPKMCSRWVVHGNCDGPIAGTWQSTEYATWRIPDSVRNTLDGLSPIEVSIGYFNHQCTIRLNLQPGRLTCQFGLDCTIDRDIEKAPGQTDQVPLPDFLLDELAEALAERLAQRQAQPEPVQQHHEPTTVAPKWTDRLAEVLREIEQEQLASKASADLVGDQPER